MLDAAFNGSFNGATPRPQPKNWVRFSLTFPYSNNTVM